MQPTMRVIAGQAHGQRLRAPRGLATRPATARVRESIFSRLAVRIDLAGIRVLDVFAGSGSLGIEALSRGAAHTTFIDSSRAAASAITSNLVRMGLRSRARVMVQEVRSALRELDAARARFDLVFVDAPYRKDISAEVLRLLADGGLISPGGWIVIRQYTRAPGPPVACGGLDEPLTATIGDHRIAFYRRPETAPGEG
ncbi:MAG TPA: 16S rRNA (guanine(966)-N(2))-methyltransferase RsmD [Candidatus Binataceae bacterium]|nr:16S rRNA (guanine(966)-N(2))-methyltransferase RsmD [Candidatus Binataceae bacterium]